jgi:hypothetical protein
MSEENIFDKANVLWGRYEALIKYKDSKFKTVVFANVVSVSEFLRTLRGLFMHAKVALEKKKDEPITLLDIEPKIALFTISKPTMSIANRENRFIYYDSKDFLAYTEDKKFAPVRNNDALLHEISEILTLAPDRGSIFIDLDEKKIEAGNRIVKKKGKNL